MKISRTYLDSPIGLIEVSGTDEGISSICFAEAVSEEIRPECLKECVRQLGEYFEGKRKTFDLKLSPEGTDFQRMVWSKLLEIPFGSTTTYSGIAASIGNKNASRAVGNAIGKNKLAIIMPCHRVIGADGSMTGFAWGVERKKWLLGHESK